MIKKGGIDQNTLRRIKKFGNGKRVQEERPALNKSYGTSEMDTELVERCRSAWDSLRGLRERRARSARYRRGDQWGDKIKNPDGLGYIKESAYIASQGRVPLKQNFIAAMVRNVVGQWRSNPTQTTVVARAREDSLASEMLTNALQAVQEVNQTDELDAQNLDTFAIGGMSVWKTTYRSVHPISLRPDGFVTNVNTDRYFFNPDIEDIRGLDIRLQGEILDLTIEQMISAFAKSKAHADELRNIYVANTNVQENYDGDDGGTSNRTERISFIIPDAPHLCRVIEAWELVGGWHTYVHDRLSGEYLLTQDTDADLSAENALRTAQALEAGVDNMDNILLEWEQKYEQTWRVSYLSPWGHVIMRMDTPYNHRDTPYSRAWAMTGTSDIWGIVEDFIDQQRYINRLITLLDFLIGVSAKGTLLVAEEHIPDDMDINDFASEWSKVGGVIRYKAKANVDAPQQISTNSVNVGAFEMLNIQLGFLQQTSGLSGAMQGQEAKSGTPSSLYAQQAQNASLNFRHLFDTYSSAVKNRDEKLLRTIMQFYDSKRYIITSGKSYSETANTFDPELADSVTDLAMVISQGVNTPTFRSMVDDQLFKLFEMQGIDVKMYLENSSLPFADRILDSIKKREESMQQGQPSGGFNPEQVDQMQQAQQAAAQQADPKAMAMIQRLMMGAA